MASRRSTILAHRADWKSDCVVALQRHPDYAGGSRPVLPCPASTTLTTATSRVRVCYEPAVPASAAGLCTPRRYLNWGRQDYLNLVRKFSQTCDDFESASVLRFRRDRNSCGVEHARQPGICLRCRALLGPDCGELAAYARRHNQAANPQKQFWSVPSEIAVGNNNS